MPVIARRNNKPLDIVNNEHFVIKQIDLEKAAITLKDEERKVDILVDQFQRFFYMAYAMTVCKSQGCTFQHNYSPRMGAVHKSPQVREPVASLAKGAHQHRLGPVVWPAPRLGDDTASAYQLLDHVGVQRAQAVAQATGRRHDD